MWNKGEGKPRVDVEDATRVTRRRLDKPRRAREKGGEKIKTRQRKTVLMRVWDSENRCVGRAWRTNVSNASFHREQSAYGSYHFIMMIAQGLWNGRPHRGHSTSGGEKKKNIKGKKKQSQANTAGSKIYAEEKLQDIQLLRLCVCS